MENEQTTEKAPVIALSGEEVSNMLADGYVFMLQKPDTHIYKQSKVLFYPIFPAVPELYHQNCLVINVFIDPTGTVRFNTTVKGIFEIPVIGLLFRKVIPREQFEIETHKCLNKLKLLGLAELGASVCGGALYFRGSDISVTGFYGYLLPMWMSRFERIQMFFSCFPDFNVQTINEMCEAYLKDVEHGTGLQGLISQERLNIIFNKD